MDFEIIGDITDIEAIEVGKAIKGTVPRQRL
jgi:hypothetical protein